MRTHQGATHFNYDLTDKPFRGARRRAREALSVFAGDPLSPEGFLDTLKAAFPQFYAGMERVRFFRWDGELAWRIAAVNTIPDPGIRRAFFASREEITKLTGWYPLIQGSLSRIYDLPPKRSLRSDDPISDVLSLGLLRSVRALTLGEKDGSSFALKCERRTLRLDFACESADREASEGQCGFLSHYHLDHAGGVLQFLERRGAVLFLSQASFVHLYQQSNEADKRAMLYAKSLIARVPTILTFRDSSQMSFFNVLHCPGAMGLAYTDRGGNTFIYSGDICLRNAFGDFRSVMQELVRSRGGQRTTLLLDAAMVGRRDQEISDEDTPQSLLDEAIASLGKRSLFFVSGLAETKVYTYIMAHTRMLAAGVRPIILVPEELMIDVRILWGEIIRGDGRSDDRVVSSVPLAERSRFAETQQLYPISGQVLDAIPAEEPCLVFTDVAALESNDRLLKRLRNSDLVLIGTRALNADLGTATIRARPRKILRVANADWSFHSDERDVAEFCRFAAGHDCRFVLFHNFTQRVKKFIKQYDLDPGQVRPMTKEPILL